MEKPSANYAKNWIWAVMLAATIVVASGRGQMASPDVLNIDKVAHFSIFGLLATLVVRVEPRWRGWLAVLAVSLFGLSDEWHQSFTPGRSVDIADWMADTLGALLAVTLYVRWAAYQRFLERPLTRAGKGAG